MSNDSSMIEVLNDVYVETISMDDEPTAKAKQIVRHFVEKIFFKEMHKIHQQFKNIFQRIFYTGSFYDGLRVGEAVEFDLNIVFKLPMNISGDLRIVKATDEEANFFQVVPGTAVLYTNKPFEELMPTSHPWYKDFQFLMSFFECVHYSGIDLPEYKYVFLPGKLCSWFEGMLYRTKTEVIKKHGTFLSRLLGGKKVYLAGLNEYITFDFKRAGPAFTMSIFCDLLGLEKIDIDLVPVFEYSCGGDTVLVPKPFPHNSRSPFLWRISHPAGEGNIFYNNSCAMTVVKLLKRFRDMQGSPWKLLSSYYLKTLVMHALRTLDMKFWLDKNIDSVFIQCLRELLHCLTSGKLLYYFDDSCNLFENLNLHTINNMKRRLSRILEDIDNNPPITLRKYFVTEESRTDTITGTSSCMIM